MPVWQTLSINNCSKSSIKMKSSDSSSCHLLDTAGGSSELEEAGRNQLGELVRTGTKGEPSRATLVGLNSHMADSIRLSSLSHSAKVGLRSIFSIISLCQFGYVDENFLMLKPAGVCPLLTSNQARYSESTSFQALSHLTWYTWCTRWQIVKVCPLLHWKGHQSRHSSNR